MTLLATHALHAGEGAAFLFIGAPYAADNRRSIFPIIFVYVDIHFAQVTPKMQYGEVDEDIDPNVGLTTADVSRVQAWSRYRLTLKK